MGAAGIELGSGERGSGGRGSRRAGAFAVLSAMALAALFLAGYAARHYTGIAGSDDYEYASIGRNVARGLGVTTQHLYPVDLPLWGRVPHPEIAHPPGLPLLIGSSFRFFGVSDRAAVAPSVACWLACVGGAVWLARRRFGSGAGWMAALLLAGHPMALGLATVALSEIPAALAVTASACFLWGGGGKRSAFAAGLALGAGQALRENVLLAAPGMGLLAGRARWDRCGWFAAGVLLALGGLAARSFAITGRPWASLAPLSIQGFTAIHPAQDVLRHLDPQTFGEFFRAHPGAFLGKWLRNVALGPIMLGLAAGAPLALALILPAAVLRFRRERWPGEAPLCARALAGMLIPTMLGVAAFAVFPRYFVPWVPLLAILAGALGARAWELRLGRLPRWAVALPIGCALLQFGWALSRPRTGNSYVAAQHFIAELVPAGVLVASDFPEIALWHADRQAAWLPVTKEEFATMRARIPIPWVCLTSRRTPAWHPSWQAVWTRKDSLAGYVETDCFLDEDLEVRMFRERDATVDPIGAPGR